MQGLNECLLRDLRSFDIVLLNLDKMEITDYRHIDFLAKHINFSPK